MRRVLQMWLFCGGLFGCSGTVESARALDASLEVTGACGDLTVVVSDAAMEWALVLEADGPVQTTREIDDVANFGFSLPGRARVGLVAGSAVSAVSCDGYDAAMGSAADAFEAVEGMAQLVLTLRSGEAPNVKVELETSGLIVEDASGARIEVGTVSVDTEMPVEAPPDELPQD